MLCSYFSCPHALKVHKSIVESATKCNSNQYITIFPYIYNLNYIIERKYRSHSAQNERYFLGLEYDFSIHVFLNRIFSPVIYFRQHQDAWSEHSRLTNSGEQ